MATKELLPQPSECCRCTSNIPIPTHLTQSSETIPVFSWPNLSLLAVRLSFKACMVKFRLLIGGENAHCFPVVSKLRTTIEADYIRPCLRSSLTAALSWLAGLGKAN